MVMEPAVKHRVDIWNPGMKTWYEWTHRPAVEEARVVVGLLNPKSIRARIIRVTEEEVE